MAEYIEQFWRAATPADAIKEPPMMARFRQDDESWVHTATLLGYDRARLFKWSCSLCFDGNEATRCFRHCEVYDEPDWHKNQPEPGEGYRLLQKFPEPEELLETDECYYPRGTWSPTNQHKRGQAEHLWYRRKIEPAASVDEPVKLVAHPIQLDDSGVWRFKSTPIQDRSYAVLNNRGYYLQWLAGKRPEYQPEFRHAFTPARLLQVSIRELGRNIRLRAVEPVDVDKLKQEIRQELQPRAVEPTPTYELGTVYEHNGRKFRLAVKGDEGDAVFGSNIGLPDALQGVARRLISVRADNFKRYQLGTGFHFQYAFVEIDEPKPVEKSPTYAVGKVYEYVNRKFRLATEGDIGKEVLRSDYSLEQSFHIPLCKLEGIVSSNEKVQYASRGYWKYAFMEITEPKQATYKIGSVYEYKGRKFRLATQDDKGAAVYVSNRGLEAAVGRGMVAALSEHKQVSLHYYVNDGKEHWRWAFIEVTEPPKGISYEPGKVYEYNGRKFRLATSRDMGSDCYCSNQSLEAAVKAERVKTLLEHKQISLHYYVNDGEEHWKWAFIEIKQPQEPEYVSFEWQDRHLLKNRYVRRKDDPDREHLILEIDRWWDGTVEVRCRDKAIRIDELLRDYVFDDDTPCGKRVEQ